MIATRNYNNHFLNWLVLQLVCLMVLVLFQVLMDLSWNMLQTLIWMHLEGNWVLLYPIVFAGFLGMGVVWGFFAISWVLFRFGGVVLFPIIFFIAAWFQNYLIARTTAKSHLAFQARLFAKSCRMGTFGKKETSTLIYAMNEAKVLFISEAEIGKIVGKEIFEYGASALIIMDQLLVDFTTIGAPPQILLNGEPVPTR